MASNLTSKFSFIGIILSLLFCSCVDNYYDNYRDCPTCPSGNNNNDTTSSKKESYRVIFTANVDEEAVRSSTTPLQQNRYAVIYSFIYQGDYISTTDYVTQQAGILTPVSGKSLTLINGKYEFYGLSIGNKSVYPPAVTDLSTGIVSGLSNGVDYLTTQSLPNTISGNTTIPLTFSHACTQIMVEVVSANATTITIDSIGSAQISQPTTNNNILSLFTGRISPSSSIQTSLTSMYISGDTCHQILLPLTYSSPLTMKFSAYINGETSARNYTASIPLPNNNLAAGSSYLYEIEITESTVTFNTVNVKNWTEVNETGTPIIPTPQ